MENRTRADIIIGCFQLDLNMYTNIQGKAIHKNVHSGYLWQWEQVALFPICMMLQKEFKTVYRLTRKIDSKINAKVGGRGENG